jgi:hypothetical protein
MANSFGTDILIQAQDPGKAASFYVKHLGFEITDNDPKRWNYSKAMSWARWLG